MKMVHALAALGATIGLLAGCGGAEQNTGSSAPPSTSAAEATADQLNFSAKTVDGQEFSGSTLMGKPAVLWFWAPWCPTCQREAPDVASAAQANPDITFVGVAALDELAAIQEFVDKYDVDTFTNIADIDGAVWQRFGVTEQPAFAFIDADGSIDVVRGALSGSELDTRVAALTASS